VTMFYPEEFWATYGRGAMVCDIETGEVITHDMPLVAHAWHRLLWHRKGPRGPFRWRLGNYLHPPGSGYLDRRHGFWPAPLRVVPKEPTP
jgi:hypothetical protein